VDNGVGAQTEAICLQRLDAGGRLPAFLINQKIPESLQAATSMKDHMQRDTDVDAVGHDALCKKVSAMLILLSPSHAFLTPPPFQLQIRMPQNLSADEETFLQEMTSKISLVNMETFTPHPTPEDNKIQVSVCYTDGNPIIVGKGVTVIDASMEECAAYELHKMSRANVRAHQEFGGLEKEMRWQSQNSFLYRVAYNIGIKGFSAREFVSRCVFRRYSDKVSARASERGERTCRTSERSERACERSERTCMRVKRAHVGERSECTCERVKPAHVRAKRAHKRSKRAHEKEVVGVRCWRSLLAFEGVVCVLCLRACTLPTWLSPVARLYPPPPL
jgi:hypothetical protein